MKTDHTDKLISLLTDAVEILDTWKHQHGLFINQDISRIKGGLHDVKSERQLQRAEWNTFFKKKN